MAGTSKPESVEATHLAVSLAESGDIAGARRALGEALTADPGYVPAWRWLAALVDSDAERRFCLEKVMSARPDARTRRALRELCDVEAEPPHEVRWAAEPPEPPEPTRPTEPSTRGRWSWRWAAALAVVVALVAGATFWVIGRSTSSRPVYVALVAGVSGGEADTTRGMVDGARMAVDEANRTGGVGGRRVELIVFDDKSDPRVARQQAEEIVRDGRAMAVIGHMLSDTSLAAAPVYGAAGLPAITPSATSDRITAENPWYFRMVFGNRTQSEFAALYLATVLGASRASVLAEDSEYGRGIRDAFSSAFSARGTVAHNVTVGLANDGIDTSFTNALAALRADPDPGPIVLALQAEHGVRVVTALRAAGITAPLFAADALAGEDFHEALTAEVARQRPQVPLGRFYAVAPMAPDALTGPALRWSTAFGSEYGYRPAWHVATTYESTVAVIHALRGSDLRFAVDSAAEDRRRIRDTLATLNRDTAPPGLLGPIRFDSGRSTEREMSVIHSDGSRFVSAPIQLVPYAPRPGLSTAEELATGQAVELRGDLLTKRRIATIGINVNEISSLDTRAGTFFADFFLWLRYPGDDSTTDITFANAVKPELTLGTPIRTGGFEGQSYRLYRVAETFKAGFDFRSYPFDHQTVGIVLQNRHLPEAQLLYVTDRTVLAQSQEERMRGGTNTNATIDHLPNWTTEEVQFYRDTAGSSAELGDPTLQASSGTFYSQYVADVRIHREIGGFLVKNLLPLALLVALVYLSLYFPAGSAIAYSIGITAILTSAVLLAAVTAPLPQVSYSVAIEWAYYAFILLATACLLVALVRQRLTEAGHGPVGDHIAVGARIAYPMAVVAIVLAYYTAFG